MHVRITSTWASTTASGDIYTIATTTQDDGDCGGSNDSITLITASSTTETDTTVTADAGDRWTITLNSQDLVSANNEHIGRYIEDLTGTTGFHRIMDSVNTASDTLVIIKDWPNDPTSDLTSGADIRIVDTINVGTVITF